MNLPKQYSWIAQEPGTKMVQEFVKLYGTTEAPGEKDNPIIIEWAKELGLGDYDHDSIPWCALLIAVIARRANKELPQDPLWALNWAKFGTRVTDGAKFGDVLVFKRNGGGHVGLYLGEDAECYHVAGGNQSDTTNIVRKSKSRLHAIRRPVYSIQPACVRKIILSAQGAIDNKES